MRIWVLVVLAACSFEPTQAKTTGGDASTASDGGAAMDAATWWNDAWSVRFPITISNVYSAALGSGYQVDAVLALSAPPCFGGSGFDDVRIVYRSSTELARVVDSLPNGNNATWFRLVAPIAAGASSTNEYYLYCHNSAATAVPDEGSAVFDFYDGFDAPLDGGRWAISNGAATSNGKLVLSAYGDTGIVTNSAFPDVNAAIDFSAVTSQATINWWGGFQTGAGDSQPWSIWYQDAYGASSGSVMPSYADNSTIANGTPATQQTSAHIYSIEDYGSAALWRFDDAVYQVMDYAPLHAPPGSFGIRLWNDSAGPGVTASFDWVRMRQAVSAAPAVTLGAVELQ